MPLVKVKDKFQVTIPASLRKAIKLDIGDLLEAEIREDGILLSRKTVTDNKDLLQKFKKVLFETMPEDSPFANKSESELMDIAIEAVKDTRAKKKHKK
jgi:AbrB family looped-hinge helix DNA binding protein